MEKLNELVEALYPKYGAPGSRDVDVTARRKAIDESAAAIAEAFRALEQRAEAAEAKLAELEKQQAVGVARMELAIGKEGLRYYQCFVDMRPDLVVAELNTGMELFTRPAPAADLVPGEWTNEQCLEFLSIAFRHAEISGDIEMDDIRLAVKMVNAAAPEMEFQCLATGCNHTSL